MAVILPGLANSTARSDRVLCFNNLRQIGVAYGNFGLEHDGMPPWFVSSSGGTSNHPLKGNLYVQFAVLSNFLATPKLLADPADTRSGLNPATHWGNTPGGLWNPAYQNKSVSYFLGLEGTFRIPRAVLSGDRNLVAYPIPSSHCLSGMTCSEVVPATVEWTNDVHGLSGNLLFYDGAVEQTDTRRLREAFGRGAGLRGTNGFVEDTRVLMKFN